MILRGDKLAQKINQETKKEIQKLKIKPGLAVILIGNNPASKLYVKLKKEAAKQMKINFYKFCFSERAKEAEILKIIAKLNQDKNVNGIIVQLPLLKKFNTDKIGLLTHAKIQKAIKKIAPTDDPYKEAKEKINSMCIDMSDEIRKVIANSKD